MRRREFGVAQTGRAPVFARLDAMTRIRHHLTWPLTMPNSTLQTYYPHLLWLRRKKLISVRHQSAHKHSTQTLRGHNNPSEEMRTPPTTMSNFQCELHPNMDILTLYVHYLTLVRTLKKSIANAGLRWPWRRRMGTSRYQNCL